MVEEKEKKCPWCSKTVKAEVKRFVNDYGNVIRRNCPECGNVLAAYLEEEGEFLAKMRSF